MRDRASALVAPLREARLRRLAGAFLVNELGDGIAVVVLPLLVYDATRSALLTGAAFGGVRALGLVGRPVGGLLADRLDRVRVLRTSFLVRALLLGAGLAAGSEAVLATCLVLAAFVGTLDNPSGEAALRENVQEVAQQVATIRKVSRALSGIVGLAVGGVLVGAVGAEGAVAVDVGTYLTAIALLPPSLRSARSHVWGAPGAALAGWPALARRLRATAVADARDGLRNLGGHGELRLVAATSAVAAALVAATLTAAVVHLDEMEAAPDGAYGLALASHSAGSVMGLVIAGTTAWGLPLGRLTRRCLLAVGVACTIGGWGAQWQLLCMSWIVWGLTWAPFEVRGDTRLVELTPERLLGRTYGGIGFVVTAGQVAGGLLAGVAVDRLGPGGVIVACGALFCGAALVLPTLSGRGA